MIGRSNFTMRIRKPYNPVSSSQRIAITHCLHFRSKQHLFGIESVIVNIIAPRFLNFNIYLNNLHNSSERGDQKRGGS